MMLELEAVARRKISVSALRAVYTIRQLAVAVVTSDGGSTSEELVTCAKEGEGAPFFLCHGDFVTRGLWAFRLVDMLRCNRRVFLVWPHPDPKLSIEEMAKCYLPHLLAAQPNGAFYLAGYCNGGVLAWEIAHQLESLGRKLECVVLIDTLSFNARAIWARVKQRVYYGPYFRAISNYLPPKLKCEIVAVVSDESQGLNVFSPIPWRSLARKIRGGEFTAIPWRCLARRVYCRYEYSTSPWRRLARKVHRKHVAGTHVGAITTHVGELALLLDDLLRDGPIFDRPATTP
jgi:thioesterase domain-containing protein